MRTPSGSAHTACNRYVYRMGIAAASEWGLAGGVAAGLVALAVSIVSVGYKWPWRGNPDGLWPRLVVTLTGVVVGGLVAAAAHSQMSGAWPAFLLGVGAPSVIRGAIARIEVEESSDRKPHPTDQIGQAKADLAPTARLKPNEVAARGGQP